MTIKLCLLNNFKNKNKKVNTLMRMKKKVRKSKVNFKILCQDNNNKIMKINKEAIFK
jgi:hypothetical protein